MPRPSILALLRHPELSGLADLGARYDLIDTPAPGIAAAIVDGGGMDAAAMDRLPDLKLIALVSVGFDAIDVDHARKRGIAVTNTPDVLTDDVADTAIGLMIGTLRRLAALDRFVRAGAWEQGLPPLARSASGRKVGIVGLGRIGSAIARRIAPMGGELRYFARHERAVDWTFEPDLVALARWAEVLIVAAAGGEETHHLVDHTILSALGPDGVLINIARGSIVDETALVALLASGALGGAGLDVFAREPAVPAALLGMDRVMLLPHQGSATVETRARMGALAIANLDAFFAGRPLLTPLW